MARVPGIGSPLGGIRDDSADPDDQSSSARLDPESVEVIGLALRAYYRALTEEPLPARLLTLLADLEAEDGDDKD
jgi:hypothetical protein